MTYTPKPSLENVQYNGGYIGDDAYFGVTFPEKAISATTGDGAVTTGGNQTVLEAINDGDTAEVNFGSDRLSRGAMASVLICATVWNYDETNETGEMWVGVEEQAEVDLISGDVKLNQQIRTNINAAPHTKFSGVIIRADMSNVVTRITIASTANFQHQTYERPDGTDGQKGRVLVKSEGENTQARLSYMRNYINEELDGLRGNPLEDGAVTTL
jgi:hypothetical protein